LVERLMLALTDEDDWVLDPFLGVGTTVAAAALHDRRGVGAELVPKYAEIARARVADAFAGRLKVRPMARPVFDPARAGKGLTTAPWLQPAPARPPAAATQLVLFEGAAPSEESP
jgi:adenine-specific DNA-methyltransferase